MFCKEVQKEAVILMIHDNGMNEEQLFRDYDWTDDEARSDFFPRSGEDDCGADLVCANHQMILI